MSVTLALFSISENEKIFRQDAYLLTNSLLFAPRTKQFVLAVLDWHIFVVSIKLKHGRKSHELSHLAIDWSDHLITHHWSNSVTHTFQLIMNSRFVKLIFKNTTLGDRLCEIFYGVTMVSVMIGIIDGATSVYGSLVDQAEEDRLVNSLR